MSPPNDKRSSVNHPDHYGGVDNPLRGDDELLYCDMCCRHLDDDESSWPCAAGECCQECWEKLSGPAWWSIVRSLAELREASRGPRTNDPHPIRG